MAKTITPGFTTANHLGELNRVVESLGSVYENTILEFAPGTEIVLRVQNGFDDAGDAVGRLIYHEEEDDIDGENSDWLYYPAVK